MRWLVMVVLSTTGDEKDVREEQANCIDISTLSVLDVVLRNGKNVIEAKNCYVSRR